MFNISVKLKYYQRSVSESEFGLYIHVNDVVYK